MYQQLLSYLQQWSESSDERRQMQHVYAFGGVVLLVLAGLVSLIDHQLGQSVATVALVAIGIFFINAIVWALVTAFVLMRLAERNQSSAVKARTKKR